MKSPPQSRLSASTHKAVVKGVSAGLTRVLCAKYAGISKDTLFSWLRFGRKDIEDGKDTKHSRLVLDIEKTEAAEAAELVSLIRSAAKAKVDNWKAAGFLLERRFPEDYVKRQEINQHHSGSVETASAEAIDERIKQLMGGGVRNDNPV